MHYLLPWLAGLLPGCIAPDAGALYRDAVALPPGEAAEHCARIDAEALSGECMTFAAAGALKSGDDALAEGICAKIRAELWRDECRFLLADRRKHLRGEAAADCAMTGRFQDDCLSHALERDYKKLPGAVRRPGAEAALLAELVDMADHYGTGEPQPTAELLLAHIIARRIGPGPLRMQACGQAPAAVCHKGFLIALSIPGPGIDRHAACQQPRTAASVAAAGLRPWSTDAEQPALAALDALCAVVASGGDPGHLGALLGETPAVPMGTHFLLPPPWLRGITEVPWDDGI